MQQPLTAKDFCDLAEEARRNGRNAIFLSKHYILQAIEFYTEAIKLNPEDRLLYRHRADCHEQCGKLPEAIADITDYIRIKASTHPRREKTDRWGTHWHTSLERAYHHRGWLNQQINELDQAILDYTSAIEINTRSDSYDRLVGCGVTSRKCRAQICIQQCAHVLGFLGAQGVIDKPSLRKLALAILDYTEIAMVDLKNFNSDCSGKLSSLLKRLDQDAFFEAVRQLSVEDEKTILLQCMKPNSPTGKHISQYGWASRIPETEVLEPINIRLRAIDRPGLPQTLTPAAHSTNHHGFFTENGKYQTESKKEEVNTVVDFELYTL